MPDRPSVSTAPEKRPGGAVRRARNLRRVGITGLSLFLIAGLTGQLGVHTVTRSRTAAGYRLSVTYASVARAGLAAPWRVSVQRDGGFGGPVTLRVTGAYFDLFDENSLDPDPSAMTADGRDQFFEFEPPEGDTLLVSFDARISPARQLGASGEAAVVEDGSDVVVVRFRTRLLP